MENEKWKKIGDRYFVSNHGNVKSIEVTAIDSIGRQRVKKGVMLSLKGLNQGYPVVNITGYGHKKNYKVHILVALMFLPNPNQLPCINHKDGNKQNNHVDNLEWCTQKQNVIHSFDVLKRKSARNFGGKNGFAKKVLDQKSGIIYGSLTEAVNEACPEIKYSTLRAMLNGQNNNYTTLKYI